MGEVSGDASARRPRSGRARDEEISRGVRCRDLPRFTGGAIGFIGYEFIHDVEPVVPRPPQDELKTPVMYFLIADQLLIFDRVAQTITVLVNAILEDAAKSRRRLRKCRRRNRTPRFAARTAAANTPPSPSPASRRPSHSNPIRRRKSFPPTSKRQGIHHRRRHHPGRRFAAVFRAGQSARRWTFTAPCAPSIRRPTCSCWNWTAFALVGASPEIHVRCEEGKVEIRPIAGTRRRGKTEPRKMRRWKRNCSPTRRSAPNTSCWWTSRATTSAASAISAACR